MDQWQKTTQSYLQRPASKVTPGGSNSRQWHHHQRQIVTIRSVYKFVIAHLSISFLEYDSDMPTLDIKIIRHELNYDKLLPTF